MAAYVLPPVNDRGQLELLHFPTRMQAFVFRTWELMPADRLAAMLGTDEATVNTLAADMGLPPQGDTACWLQRGYITVIKANWHRHRGEACAAGYTASPAARWPDGTADSSETATDAPALPAPAL